MLLEQQRAEGDERPPVGPVALFVRDSDAQAARDRPEREAREQMKHRQRRQQAIRDMRP